MTTAQISKPRLSSFKGVFRLQLELPPAFSDLKIVCLHCFVHLTEFPEHWWYAGCTWCSRKPTVCWEPVCTDRAVTSVCPEDSVQDTDKNMGGGVVTKEPKISPRIEDWCAPEQCYGWLWILLVDEDRKDYPKTPKQNELAATWHSPIMWTHFLKLAFHEESTLLGVSFGFLYVWWVLLHREWNKRSIFPEKYAFYVWVTAGSWSNVDLPRRHQRPKLFQAVEGRLLVVYNYDVFLKKKKKGCLHCSFSFYN